MQCIYSRSHEPTNVLTDRTLAVEQIMGGRSLLPPSPTAEELLQLLRESGHPCTSLLKPEGSAGVLELISASFSPSNITRRCPSSARVTSSFAAAGAHSMLGEMLQFFAEHLTRLFVLGVGDPLVRAFPSEWERRLHAPAAASLRQHYLYELQGFGTLFMFIWGKVAASYSFSVSQGGEKASLEPTNEATMTWAAPALSAIGKTRPQSPQKEQPLCRPSPPHSASTATLRKPQSFLPTMERNSSSSLRNGKIAVHGRPCISFASVPLLLPDTEASSSITVKKQPKYEPSASTLSRSGQQSGPLAVFQHALTAQARAQKPFLPSIPPEGLVPSTPRSELATREVENVHPTSCGVANPNAPHLQTSVTTIRNATASHLTPSQTLSVERAMQLDREKELQKEFGVRRVRNYAGDEEMRKYLHSYEANVRSVLEEDAALAGGL